jgi:hypothetical protein
VKEFFICLLVIVLVFGMIWLIQGNDFFMYKVFAPKMEQVRRETFEQSKAYRQGMVQELNNMRFEYLKTTDENSKEAMASIILHRVADFDENAMPNDLRQFIQELKNKQYNMKEMNY